MNLASDDFFLQSSAPFYCIFACLKLIELLSKQHSKNIKYLRT